MLHSQRVVFVRGEQSGHFHSVLNLTPIHVNGSKLVQMCTRNLGRIDFQRQNKAFPNLVP
jgi:hypothetical protein